MDILLFRDLARLRRTGNFSQAATEANLSQPAFSRRIRVLESWVGVPLVDRSRQPVSLNAAGAQMLEAGLQALARIEGERSQILESHALPDKYVVTFGAQHSIGWRFFPAWLQALEETYGPFLSRLRADDLPNCLRDLGQGDVDFVIAYDRPGNDDDDSNNNDNNNGDDGNEPVTATAFAALPDRALRAHSILIGRDRLLPVCKPGRDGKPFFRFDDSGVPMPYLRFGDAAPIGRHLEPLFRTHNLTGRLRVVYENAMAGALRIRAREGIGVAWLPESLLAPDLKAGLLVPVGDAGWTVNLDIRMYRNTRFSNRVTRAIWSFLEVRQSVPLIPAVA